MIFCIRLHPLVMTPIMDCAFKFLLRDCSYSARVNISLLLRILQNDALSSWYMQVVLVSGIMCAAYIQKVICSFRYIYCRSCMQMERVEVFFPLLCGSFKNLFLSKFQKKNLALLFNAEKNGSFQQFFLSMISQRIQSSECTTDFTSSRDVCQVPFGMVAL